jgi:hypothetical protein
MNKILLSSLAAIAFALSASAAFAQGADQTNPDNPILAEQYFYDHQAVSQQMAAETAHAHGQQARFLSGHVHH